jgi:hypothetical protein
VTGMSVRVRVLFRVMALLYLAVGGPWFFAPTYWAERFPWAVTPFVAMTIGAWCLGNAWVALVAARLRRWTLVRAIVVYLLAFGVGQVGVLVWFRDRLVTDHPLTWPYVAVLVLTVIAGVAATVDMVRAHPIPDLLDEPAPRWGRGFVVVFALFVIFLAAVALAAPPVGLEGRVFPEELSPFTLRAFGAFYLALGISALALMPVRVVRPTLCFGLAGMGLVVPITVAIPVFWTAFDIMSHPLQALYIVAYVGVLIATSIGLAGRREMLRG